MNDTTGPMIFLGICAFLAALGFLTHRHNLTGFTTMEKTKRLLLLHWKEIGVAMFMAFSVYQLLEIKAVLSANDWELSRIRSDVGEIRDAVERIQRDRR